MCGVIGLLYERARSDLGQIAGELLKTLEYRGYDSTGAAIQDAGQEVILKKDVGAPSVMIHRLGITELAGQLLCAQVRWATFGAVDQPNSQPHVVRCKTFVYGAHNGNVTNCDALKLWLKDEGHDVRSDNDGEMVVHTIEHYFAGQLQKLADDQDFGARREAMRAAIQEAGAHLKGSYAAVIVDPVSKTEWALKMGSSLYFGIGEDEVGGRFGIASSDLSSVLKLTRVVVPISEGDFVEFTADGYQVYRLASGQPLTRKPVRSRLRAKDTALLPPFETFMDQEIYAQSQTSQDVIRIFSGGSEATRQVGPVIDSLAEDERTQIEVALEQLQDQYLDDAIKSQFQALMRTPAFQMLLGRLPASFRKSDDTPEKLADGFCSAERGFFADLVFMAQNAEERRAVKVLDAFLERQEISEYTEVITEFCQRCIDTLDRGGRIYLVCCGSSYHAAKSACLFFNDLASTEVIALLPGEFRGQYAHTLRSGDLFIAVSQSGETKDLIDVVNSVIEAELDIGRVALVNNVNSTLAQEKSELVIPLRCGPEIAVPATKSFINQLTVFYCLAVRLAERRLTTGHVIEGQAQSAELSQRNLSLPALPSLIQRTIEETDAGLSQAADLLYLCPSLHLLATRLLAVAREGALKVREVVLNHTEGFEASEFKHGPNTILGFKTIYGPLEVQAMLKTLGELVAESPQKDAQQLSHLASLVFGAAERPEDIKAQDRLRDSMYSDYPLVYITGPDARDKNLTISQINTHKIRGATTVIIAEEDEALRVAAEKPPADNPNYRSVYVTLPKTGDTLMTVFSATVALQRLALKMSLKKLAYLDALGFKEHGVHPDVPKNVSKSITVD